MKVEFKIDRSSDTNSTYQQSKLDWQHISAAICQFRYSCKSVTNQKISKHNCELTFDESKIS